MAYGVTHNRLAGAAVTLADLGHTVILDYDRLALG